MKSYSCSWLVWKKWTTSCSTQVGEDRLKWLLLLRKILFLRLRPCKFINFKFILSSSLVIGISFERRISMVWCVLELRINHFFYRFQFRGCRNFNKSRSNYWYFTIIFQYYNSFSFRLIAFDLENKTRAFNFWVFLCDTFLFYQIPILNLIMSKIRNGNSRKRKKYPGKNVIIIKNPMLEFEKKKGN